MNSEAFPDLIDDEDYFVRLAAFLWRFRTLCILVLVVSALAGAIYFQAMLPRRTALSLRLVSPSVSYRYSDYWVSAGKMWRAQLVAMAGERSRPDRKISIRATDEPWLFELSAEHTLSDVAEDDLRKLVSDAQSELRILSGVDDEADSRVLSALGSAGPTELMSQLKYRLLTLEQLLQQASTETEGAVASVVRTGLESGHLQISGTATSVPVQSVPYYPWYESVQQRVCQRLAASGDSKIAKRLSEEQRNSLSENLEQASLLLTQVWFGMDPLNPANQLPSAQIQRAQQGSSGHSLINTVALSCWFGLAVILALAIAGEWLMRNSVQIFYGKRSNSLSERFVQK